ncbi:MAG: response regulator [Desulfobacterales bacterium]|nr:response regulator [Desulfobacterales bacterium]
METTPVENTGPDAIRVLVADDEETTLELYQDVFDPDDEEDEEDDDEFSRAPSEGEASSGQAACDVVFCRQGDEAVEAVRTAVAENRPFAAAFIDVKMPPGPDGIWAAKNIRELDPFIEIMMVTAFSDLHPREFAGEIPPSHKLFFLRKPFRTEEIHQFAGALGAKWRMENRLREAREELEKKVEERTAQLARANRELTRDIAERRKVEAALRESEKRYKSIFDFAADGIAVIAPDGAILDANRAYCRMHDRPRENIIGMKLGDLSNLDFTRDLQARLDKTGSHQIERIEGVDLREDGSTFPVEITIAAFPHEGEPALLGFFRDMSERARSEKEIFVAKKEWARTFDAIEDIVTIHDDRMNIVRMNQAARAAFSTRGDDLVGKACHEVFRDDPAHCPGCPVSMDGKLHALNVMEIDCPSREDFYHVTLSPIFDNEGALTGVVRTAKDLTRQKELESRLRQAQKMESIGTLAGGIAHDFNNSLMTIMLNTELALFRVKEDDATRESLEMALKASQRARDLVKQILTFSRKGEQNFRPIIAAPIIKESLKMLRASLPSTIEIRQHIEAGEERVLSAPGQIHQILINLCSNAAHAMREKGGALEVRLGSRGQGSEMAGERSDLDRTPHLMLEVRDTGPGISPEERERIFDPFYTTKPPGEGTGMGLAVVHGIVEGMGGVVKVESEPGKGAAFQVFMPLIEDREESTERDAAPPPRGEGNLLLVEDDEFLRICFRRALRAHGRHITTTNNGRDALELFIKDPWRFDLIITDQTMPGLTGVELAKKTLEIRPDLPIILCTGYSEVIDKERAEAMGLRKFFIKPVGVHELNRAVSEILNRCNEEARYGENTHHRRR